MIPTPAVVAQGIRSVIVAVAIAATVPLAGCAPAARDREPLSVREITPTFLLPAVAARPVRDPALAADTQGTVALVWVSGDSAHADVWLSVSRDSGTRFSAPARVNVAAGLVVSFSECRPAVALGPGGALVVAWSERRADSTGAVDLRARASGDFGRTLGSVTTLNDDAAGPPPGLRWRQRHDWPLAHRPDAFHGFAAVAYTAEDGLLATWLDDRRAPPPAPGRRSTLWRAISTDGGQSWGANVAVSDSACPRCRPALAVATDGAVALAYRDGANDARDPRLALSFDGGSTFTADTLVSRDGWSLAGCPDQGPALVWDRPRGGTYAWYTGTQPAGVYVMRWRRAGGAAGLRRAVADSLADAERPRHPLVATLGDIVVIGVDSPVAGRPELHTFAVRTLDLAGTWSPWTFLGADATSGALASVGAMGAIACWVEREPGATRLRLAALARRSGPRA